MTPFSMTGLARTEGTHDGLSARHRVNARGLGLRLRLPSGFDRLGTDTPCARSATASLTTTGLQLHATIEQFRERVQTVE